MKFFLRTRTGAKAIADYDEVNNLFIVLKGSNVSPRIANSPKFHSSNSIAKTREKFVENLVVLKDVVFKSPSTAANFITGTSTNGCRVWKDENGICFQDAVGGK